MRICFWWQSVSRECQMGTKKRAKSIYTPQPSEPTNIDVRGAALLAVSTCGNAIFSVAHIPPRKIALISEICITFNEILNGIIYAHASKFNKVYKLYTQRKGLRFIGYGAARCVCVRGLDYKTVNKFQQSTALGELSCNVVMLFLRDRAKKTNAELS